ncbi:energy transducer TonB [Ferruginibacter sp. HRS2-29]|uniref:energy transducer TonB n=1 Tax=Ferruginibacter sp. HRS2-29 TaxID=2487334 RepID=UPI0020CBEC29|nr:energy transducer TonB [Ferruginibacter sp. HRS2-29]MCP9752164.1 hypothetical protein [Ferruginibacter sp. HRS2-29]
MKQLLLAFVLLHFASASQSQKIVDLIYVGDNGVTEDIKETKYFILIKEFPGSVFRRLDYKLHGPLMTVKTYKDRDMKILNGSFYSYRENGLLQIQGTYEGNKKDGSWYYYNDTFKVVKEEKYDHGTLLQTIDPDTVKKEKAVEYPDERRGEFKGGPKAWVKFIQSTINPDVAAKSVKGGKVLVGFMINKNGDLETIHLRKSVEFVLDEEALRVIYKSPQWIPAFRNGHTVNAYRIQPISFQVI